MRPETILAWLRKLVARKLDGSKNRSSDGRLPYCCFSGRTEEKTPQSLNEAEPEARDDRAHLDVGVASEILIAAPQSQ